MGGLASDDRAQRDDGVAAPGRRKGPSPPRPASKAPGTRMMATSAARAPRRRSVSRRPRAWRRVIVGFQRAQTTPMRSPAASRRPSSASERRRAAARRGTAHAQGPASASKERPDCNPSPGRGRLRRSRLSSSGVFAVVAHVARAKGSGRVSRRLRALVPRGSRPRPRCPSGPRPARAPRSGVPGAARPGRRRRRRSGRARPLPPSRRGTWWVIRPPPNGAWIVDPSGPCVTISTGTSRSMSSRDIPVLLHQDPGLVVVDDQDRGAPAVPRAAPPPTGASTCWLGS